MRRRLTVFRPLAYLSWLQCWSALKALAPLGGLAHVWRLTDGKPCERVSPRAHRCS